jgi:hypothetical protein
MALGDRPLDLSDLQPAFTARLNPFLAALDQAGIKYRVDSAYRSPEQQAEIWQRSNHGASFPAAPPWGSFHNYGLAADVIPNDPNDYQRMWDMSRQFGLTPLGPTAIHDKPHFQMAGGNLSQVLAANNISQGWRPASMPAPEAGAVPYGGIPSSAADRASAGALWHNPASANLPMGMGNNNPANIKFYPGPSFAGVTGPSKNTDQGDPQFVFESPQAGMNAAANLLGRKYAAGMTTPAAIIAGQSGWTPGNMRAAANVAKSAGIGVNQDIDWNNPAKAQNFLSALVRQEQGGASSYYPSALYASAIGSATSPSASGTTLTSTPAQPDRSIDPSIWAHGGTSSAPVDQAAPGSVVGGTGGQFGSSQPANALVSTTQKLRQAFGGGQGQGPKPIGPSPMLGAPPETRGLGPSASRPGVYQGTYLQGLDQPVGAPMPQSGLPQIPGTSLASGPPLGTGLGVAAGGQAPPLAAQGPPGTSLMSLAMQNDPSFIYGYPIGQGQGAQFPMIPMGGTYG